MNEAGAFIASLLADPRSTDSLAHARPARLIAGSACEFGFGLVSRFPSASFFSPLCAHLRMPFPAGSGAHSILLRPHSRRTDVTGADAPSQALVAWTSSSLAAVVERSLSTALSCQTRCFP